MTRITLFAVVLSLVGPAPADSPQASAAQARRPDRRHRRFDHRGGGYFRDIDAVLAAQYPEMKIPKVINKGISGQKAEDLVSGSTRTWCSSSRPS